MIKYIQDILVFLVLYIPPLIIFLKYLKKKDAGILVMTLLSISYIIFSIFTQNLFPFILVLFNIHYIRTLGAVQDTYFYRSDYEIYNFSFKRFKLFNAIKYSIRSYAITLIISIASYALLSYYKVPVEEQQIVTELMKKPILQYILMVPLMVVFAPVVEEFTFRWLLFEKIFKTRLGVVFSAILSSVIFAFVHFNIKSFVVLTVVGLINCYLIHNKGYWYAVFNHAFFNTVTAVLMLYEKLTY